MRYIKWAHGIAAAYLYKRGCYSCTMCNRMAPYSIYTNSLIAGEIVRKTRHFLYFCSENCFKRMLFEEVLQGKFDRKLTNKIFASIARDQR